MKSAKTRTPTVFVQTATRKMVKFGSNGDMFNITLTHVPSEATIFHKGDDVKGLERLRQMIEEDGKVTGLKLVPVKIEVFFD